MKVITIAVWVLRIAVLAAIILGILFWTGNAENLIPVHMLIGIIAVLSLWVIGLAQGFIRGGSFGLALAPFIVGLALAIVGLYQQQWLLGSSHWIIQVIHLPLCLSPIGLGELIDGRTRRLVKNSAAG